MTPCPWTSSYRIIATLLAILEILGCGLGIRMFLSDQRYTSRDPTRVRIDLDARNVDVISHAASSSGEIEHFTFGHFGL
jgi:hypothetical protein